MQSVELSALRAAVTQRWGSGADLSPLLRTLDLDGLAGLTVGAVAAHIGRSLGAGGPVAAGPREAP